MASAPALGSPQYHPPHTSDVADGAAPTVATPHSPSRALSSSTLPSPRGSGVAPLSPSPSSRGVGSDYNFAEPGSPESSLSNFARYGAIRPPPALLQDQFLEAYRRWRECAEPLEGLEGLEGGEERRGDCMAKVRELHARRMREEREKSRRAGNDLWGWTGGAESPGPAGPSHRGGCEGEEKVAVSDEDDAAIPKSDDDGGEENDEDASEERIRLLRLSSLLLRPGSRLVGRIETPIANTAPVSNGALRRTKGYDLVVLEDDVPDELGQPQGALCRHRLGGDPRCVFVEVQVVEAPEWDERSKNEIEDTGYENEGKRDLEEEECVRDEEDAYLKMDDDAGKGEGNATTKDKEKSGEDGQGTKKSSAIQIRYSDGDVSMLGMWNPVTLRFEGTWRAVLEGGRTGSGGSTEDQRLGGTIISGLISGHEGYADESERNGGVGGGGGSEESSEQDEEGRDGRRPSLARRPISPSTGAVHGAGAFHLSPSTHLHPQGVNPPLSPVEEALSRAGLTGLRAEGTLASGAIVLRPAGASPPSADAATPGGGRKDVPSPERQSTLTDELFNADAERLASHRAHVERLRRDALARLAELGAVVDFAELARKRNAARRREKWQNRIRRIMPRRPNILSRRRKGGADKDVTTAKRPKERFHDQLAAIAWSDLLEEASFQSERTCAQFRRRASLLDGLNFDSDVHKSQVLLDLRAGGLTLAGSHAEWDRCIRMGRTVALGWSWFERGSWGCFERSAVVGRRCVHLLFQMHSRLEASHRNLEKSFRAADARLTGDQLGRIRDGFYAPVGGCREDGESSSVGVCGICQCEMQEGEGGEVRGEPPACLPCSHMFHWECIHEWLHSHSQCPICRVELNTS